MRVRRRRRHATARCAMQKSVLHQVRFVHIFDRRRFFTHRGRDGVEPDRTAAELTNNRRENLAVNRVQTGMINFHRRQRQIGNL